MAFLRNERGLLDDDHWKARDLYFIDIFSNQAERISKAHWDDLQYGFDAAFWVHVDEALFVD